MNANAELDPQLSQMLSQLRQAVPARNEATARQGRAAFMRAAFLAQAQAVRVSSRQVVLGGLAGWGADTARRARQRFAAALVSLLLVTGLASGTAFAAQGSLPNQALYPVKLFIEDTRVALASDARSRAALQLGYAERRLQELAQVSADADAARIANTRLQHLVQAALQNAAQLGDDASLKQTLTQADDLVSRQVLALQENATPASGALQAELATQRALIATGLADPQQFREAVRGARPPIVPSTTPTAPPVTATPVPTPTPTVLPTTPPQSTRAPAQATPQPSATPLPRPEPTQPTPTATRLVPPTLPPRASITPRPATPNARATRVAVLTALPTLPPPPDLRATRDARATALPRPTLPPAPDLKATRAALQTSLPRPTPIARPTLPPPPDLRATRAALVTEFPRPTPLPPPPTPGLRATREAIRTALPKPPTPQRPPTLPAPQPTSPSAIPTDVVPPSPPTLMPTQPPLPTREPRPTRRSLPTDAPPPSPIAELPTPQPPPEATATPAPPPADTPAPTEAPTSVPIDATPTEAPSPP